MSTAARLTPGTAGILVRVFDGARQPFPAGAEVLIRVIDGNQKQVHSAFHKESSVEFQVPFFNNLGDRYTVIASADRHVQAGFTPVRISQGVVQNVDLMLLPQDGNFNFRAAAWKKLKQASPALFKLLSFRDSNDEDVEDRYTQLMEKHPASLAAILNITTAMEDIHLQSGNPLDYFKKLIWGDDTIRPDRFFGYAQKTLLDQVRQAETAGLFAPEPAAAVFHPGATSSFKQVQFGEANVQITFHENDTAVINKVDCVKVEADMDYFRDALSHAILEVIPNRFGGTTDPRRIYALRWIAGRRAGAPEFDPPYIIEA